MPYRQEIKRILSGTPVPGFREIRDECIGRYVASLISNEGRGLGRTFPFLDRERLLSESGKFDFTALGSYSQEFVLVDFAANAENEINAGSAPQNAYSEVFGRSPAITPEGLALLRGKLRAGLEEVTKPRDIFVGFKDLETGELLHRPEHREC